MYICTICVHCIFIFFSFPFSLFLSVLSDARSHLVRLDDPAPVPVHAPVPVLVPARMAAGLILVLDLALAHALCSDRHNTYTSHVSQLSYFNVASYTLLHMCLREFTLYFNIILVRVKESTRGVYRCLCLSYCFFQ